MNRRVVVTGLGCVTPIGNNVEEFWKGIDELVELLAENKVLEEALHLIENMKFSISKSAKLRHFKNLYDEHCYHLYMWRRAEQEAKERGDDFYGDN